MFEYELHPHCLFLTFSVLKCFKKSDNLACRLSEFHQLFLKSSKSSVDVLLVMHQSSLKLLSSLIHLFKDEGKFPTVSIWDNEIGNFYFMIFYFNTFVFQTH